MPMALSIAYANAGDVEMETIYNNAAKAPQKRNTSKFFPLFFGYFMKL